MKNPFDRVPKGFQGSGNRQNSGRDERGRRLASWATADWDARDVTPLTRTDRQHSLLCEGGGQYFCFFCFWGCPAVPGRLPDTAGGKSDKDAALSGNKLNFFFLPSFLHRRSDLTPSSLVRLWCVICILYVRLLRLSLWVIDVLIWQTVRVLSGRRRIPLKWIPATTPTSLICTQRRMGTKAHIAVLSQSSKDIRLRPRSPRKPKMQIAILSMTVRFQAPTFPS